MTGNHKLIPTHLVGRKFGKLTVLEYAGSDVKPCGKIRHRWMCLCDCGKISQSVSSSNLLRKTGTKSCGCARMENALKAVVKHGMYNTPEYGAWCNLIARCYRKTCKEYSNYGARGITVCKRWRKSFVNFITDMGLRPSNKHSIDRVNNNKNYSKANCQWRTSKDQMNNQRRNVNLTFGKKTQTISQWAEELGLRASSLDKRLKLGWTVANALSLPRNSKNPVPRKS